MFTTNLSEVLAGLDLTTSQIQIYEALLKNRSLSITELARALGTHRMAIYRDLEVLETKGLLENKERDKNSFLVTNPNKILTLLRQNQVKANKAVSDFQAYLPEILTNWYAYSEPVFRTYDGKDKFWLLFNNLLENAPANSTIYEIGMGQDFYNLLDLDYFDNVWRPKRIQKNVFSKILARTDDPHFSTSSTRTQYLRDWRFLPAKFEKLGSIWISGDTIILWDTFNARAFEIRNHTMSQFLIGIFEVLWGESTN